MDCCKPQGEESKNVGKEQETLSAKTDSYSFIALLKSRAGMRCVIIILLILSGIYLVVDHGEHLSSFLPFIFLLGCFFMHLFMPHGSHGGHTKGGESDHSGKDVSHR